MIRLTLFIVPLGIIYILCACAISPAEVFAAPTSVRPNRRGSDGSSDGLLSDDSLAVPVSVLRAVYRPVQVYDHHPTSSDSSSTLSTPCTSSDTGAGVGVRDDHDRDSENSSAGQPDKRELLVSVPFLDSPSPVIVHPRHGTDPRVSLLKLYCRQPMIHDRFSFLTILMQAQADLNVSPSSLNLSFIQVVF
ncbi:hypothetical protein F5880DRAFT_975887 [Lentinula raphanica]|nr:hypothetical protein F5880DRAFT_975887 [Lentinula raphanica]